MQQQMLQVQDRSSNDGAESVEAKQETSEAEEEDAEDAGINLDAESVHARGDASEDDSDMEDGEIHGKHRYVLCASCSRPPVCWWAADYAGMQPSCIASFTTKSSSVCFVNHWVMAN